MKQKKGISTTLVGLLSLALVGTGCSTNTGNSNSASPTVTSTVGTETAKASATTATDPFGKYDPPITVNGAIAVPSTLKFLPGQTIDKNVWTDEYANALGINLKYNFSANSEGYLQKLNVNIASNNIPDIFQVDNQRLSSLESGGKLADLTDAFNKYASPLLKQVYNADKGETLKTATFNGKLMGLPVLANGDLFSAQMVWIRTDWLKKLNLPEPKTMQDLLNIAKAFTTQDPNGNGKGGTYGLGLTKDLYGSAVGSEGFFQGYHSYPTLWVKDASGKLAYGSIQPETKAALTALQQLYKSGVIDQEFAVKDAAKVGEDNAQNKVGILFGVNWLCYYPIDIGIQKNPGMDWKPYPLLSIDDKRAIPGVKTTASNFVVVKAGYSNPEALVKMMNLYYEKYFSKSIDEYHKFILDKDPTYSVNQQAIVGAAIPIDYDLQVADNLKAAITSKDTSNLGANEKDFYDSIQKFLAGDRTQWATNRQRSNIDSSYNVWRDYKKDGFMPVQFYGAPTPTMLEKKATLDKLEKEEFVKIIMGAVPVDDFDDFVSKWKKLGGDQITQEVNDWKAKQK